MHIKHVTDHIPLATHLYNSSHILDACMHTCMHTHMQVWLAANLNPRPTTNAVHLEINLHVQTSTTMMIRF